MPARRKTPPPKGAPTGKPKAAPPTLTSQSERVLSGVVSPVAGPRTTSEMRDLLREKLEALLPHLERAVMAGRVDALDYASFLAKYSLGEKTPTQKLAVRHGVVMLPPRAAKPLPPSDTP